ncbi:MAG TPA: hypothetical protein VFA35_05160 [Burkholderiaceae bacterium]|nr:hypothetical protein [Burkholderiaceae bacterium]
MSITNNSGNPTTHVQFSGGTDVSGDLTQANGNAGATATYVETIPKSACTPTTPGGTTIQCDPGKMNTGANKSFVVIFAAPSLAAADHWASDAKINFTWTFDYGSGNTSGTPSSLLCNGVVASPPPCIETSSTGLVTTATNEILEKFLTYIPSFGGTFWTGNGSSVLGPDGSNLRPTALTKLKVPTGLNLTTAQVTLTVASGAVSGNTTTTNTAVVEVPNGGNLFGSFVTIELRRDASTILKGAKIANAVVSYSHDDPNALNPVQPCPTGGIPTIAQPVCLFGSPIEFTKKNAPTPDDVGDWLFVIHALENGVLNW